jgi:hypothetical protein
VRLGPVHRAEGSWLWAELQTAAGAAPISLPVRSYAYQLGMIAGGAPIGTAATSGPSGLLLVSGRAWRLRAGMRATLSRHACSALDAHTR